MAFFKRSVKEQDKRAELPELPGTSKLPELPPLPTLPESKANDSFGLQAIKSTIQGEQLEPNFREKEEKRTIELGEPSTSAMQFEPRKMEIKKEPVFVKLDKFKDSVEKFEDIKQKVHDIDGTLRKIKEIRDREDNELKVWEEKVQLIKEKVDNIDNSLFSRI